MTTKRQREELVVASLERIAIALERILELAETEIEQNGDDDD